jgi:hypothetical protein
MMPLQSLAGGFSEQMNEQASLCTLRWNIDLDLSLEGKAVAER